MIEVIDLTKYYGERKILHSLNFSVGEKRICGFLGPNGSGKSTTMDILAGLLGPSSGSAKVNGFDVVKESKEVKNCVGYLPDNPPLYKEMTVYDFVNFVAKIKGVSKFNRKKNVDLVIEECDVGSVQSRLIGNLSKGFRQRVALCSALVHKPKVLILDEPTEGLDPNQILLIRNLIKKLALERTVIMSSHILSEVQATCDEVIVINHGHIATKILLDKNENNSNYKYTFASNVQDAFTWFQKCPVASSVTLSPQNEKCIHIKFTKEFCLDKNFETAIAQITKDLVSQNFTLIGIEQRKDELEDMFFNVIRSQPNAIL